jgi:hypothetical protein
LGDVGRELLATAGAFREDDRVLHDAVLGLGLEMRETVSRGPSTGREMAIDGTLHVPANALRGMQSVSPSTTSVASGKSE